MFVGSRNLQLFVDAANKSLLKRIQVAQDKVAEYLNNVFHHRGPPSSLDQVLGGSGQSLLRAIFPASSFEDGKGAAPFPSKDSSPRPLQRFGDAQLQMTVGLLRQFDARQNSAAEGGSPFCYFLERRHSAALLAGSEPA